MAIDYIALGQRISDFRNKHNFSQEELAFRSGVGNKHISNIELEKENRVWNLSSKLQTFLMYPQMTC